MKTCEEIIEETMKQHKDLMDSISENMKAKAAWAIKAREALEFYARFDIKAGYTTSMLNPMTGDDNRKDFITEFPNKARACLSEWPGGV